MLADSVGQNLGVLVTVIGAAIVILTGVIVTAKTRGQKGALDIVTLAYESVKTVNADQAAQIAEQKVDFDKQIAEVRHECELKMVEQDRDCQRQLGEVRGQLQVLTGKLGENIIQAVVDGKLGENIASAVIAEIRKDNAA